MSDINWRQKRKIYRDRNGEILVAVYRGYMFLDDYIEGGVTYSEPELAGPLEFVAELTNAQISNGDAREA